METKGYGLTLHDIDWSCPTDLEPYEKARKLELVENDGIIHAACGSYVLSAVSVAVEHCLAGRKARSKYIENPIMQELEKCRSGYKESSEDIAVYEMKLRSKALREQGFPESPE